VSCLWVSYFNLAFTYFAVLINYFFRSPRVHRVGRTGRAGKKGTAISFFVAEKNGRMARELIEILKKSAQTVPPELSALAAFSGGGRGGGGRGRGRGRGRY
jgi:ATP-dependent RNA helicase DDX5/DBP2